MGLGLRRRFEAAAGFPPLKRLLTAAHFACADRSSGSGRHPLDVAYGVRTQGAMPLYLNRTGSAADQDMIPYAGCVPSVLRRVLDTLPGLRHASFLDLGCGKGRALVIASEYPFAALFGVELNAALVTVARRNLDRVRLRHPDRPPVEVRCGDASRSHLPEGDLVVFLYHPFGERLVQTLCDHLLAIATGAVHLVYENPVHGEVFDRSPGFQRWSAAMLDYSEEELGHGFDTAESVVVWRTPSRTAPAPLVDAERAIRVTKPGFRAVVV